MVITAGKLREAVVETLRGGVNECHVETLLSGIRIIWETRVKVESGLTLTPRVINYLPSRYLIESEEINRNPGRKAWGALPSFSWKDSLRGSAPPLFQLLTRICLSDGFKKMARGHTAGLLLLNIQHVLFIFRLTAAGRQPLRIYRL